MSGSPESLRDCRRSVALQWLAILWFLTGVLLFMFLVFSDHWLIFFLGLTPAPSLIVPVSTVWLIFLLAVQRRSAPWALAALGLGLALTPFGLGAHVGLTQRASLRDVSDSTVSILTSNAGKRNRDELLQFVNHEHPDLVAIQAARLPPESPVLENFHRASEGRLSLWSRWPILASEPIVETDRVVVARFEVAGPREPFVVYVLHLPSPREALGSSTRLRNAVMFQRQKWDLLTRLSERVTGEKGAVLVVGDANQPAFGPAYRLLTDRLQDGQREAGWGFGHTLQSLVNSRFPYVLPPWTRIDYILANDKFEFVSHRVEPHHKGQHRALIARLRLVPR